MARLVRMCAIKLIAGRSRDLGLNRSAFFSKLRPDGIESQVAICKVMEFYSQVLRAVCMGILGSVGRDDIGKAMSSLRYHTIKFLDPTPRYHIR
ncbi:predicted protein [Sclerotinia sclerotiorum 1980 UF-70]|uniref:Uncharacterized protein n=1 Tax=Sclerotinia sclerotiorum (strain ATCC 18683 / 1980 / Ss-1) TaxID=665079 RepID=A7E6G8_SCLS1|nr:predicted protein [Sclerotinia sclerotiorum 1980 UF-70]EDN91490.1 predicted protein [Sclerotinia sclerotiorum 1980 UF-70]